MINGQVNVGKKNTIKSERNFEIPICLHKLKEGNIYRFTIKDIFVNLLII